MKAITLAGLAVATFAATPVSATGGLLCKTAGSRQIEVSVGFGHVPGSPLILVRLRDRGSIVPSASAQWWLDNAELRLLLIDPQTTNQQLLLKAKRNGHVYDGSLWRGGKRHWVRCRED